MKHAPISYDTYVHIVYLFLMAYDYLKFWICILN